MVARWFRISYAENALRRYATDRDIPFHGLRPTDLLDLMVGFFRDRRAQHAATHDEGDGLLWQWGPDADAARFTIGMTRQLIREGNDQPIIQVTVCLSYRWTPGRRALGRGHVWCFDPATADDFRRDVAASPAYRAVIAAIPTEVIVRTDSL